MSSFDDRKDAFEKKYAHDQDFIFRVEARASKLMGLWVAEQLGMTGDAAAAYAKEVVSSNLEEAGFDDVKRKVSADLKAKNVEISAHALDKQMDRCFEEAKNQVMNDSAA